MEVERFSFFRKCFLGRGMYPIVKEPHVPLGETGKHTLVLEGCNLLTE